MKTFFIFLLTIFFITSINSQDYNYELVYKKLDYGGDYTTFEKKIAGKFGYIIDISQKAMGSSVVMNADSLDKMLDNGQMDFRNIKDVSTLKKPIGLEFDLFYDAVDGLTYRYFIEMVKGYRTNDFSSLDPLLIKDSILIRWTLVDDYKTIEGYKCQKAITQFRCWEYEAWISLDHPCKFGPFVFNNAPGLIISLSRSDKERSWQLLSFKTMPYKDSERASKYRNGITTAVTYDFCYLKSDFLRFKNLLNRLYGDKDCKDCTTQITDISIAECFDECNTK